MEAHHIVTESPLLVNEEQASSVLTIFLHEEVRRTGLSKAVIGLSGGVDSALSTYLSVRALGKENVHVVMMPYKTSNPESIKDAMEVVDALDISSEIIDISPAADALFENIPNDKTRRGNVMARLRMIALYDRSQAFGGLVIGTSNKTESLLGYTTLYGDNASAINPLRDLYKTQVWQIAKYLGIPDNIVNKAPTADLWPGQTDESELGFTYKEADEILFYMIDLRERDEELIKRGFSVERVKKIRDTVRRTQYKRRTPIIAKISSRTINTDFRYPRDWGT